MAKRQRTVDLPYRFGQVMFLANRDACIPGMVVGYTVIPGALKPVIRWSNDPNSSTDHFLCELTEEYEPRFGPRYDD